MIDARTIRFLLVVTVLSAGSISLGGEPNAVAIELTFEDGSAPLSWAGEGTPRPSHAAGITLHQPRDKVALARASDSRQDFLRSSLAGYQEVPFSQKQEAFLRAMHPAFAIWVGPGRMTATGSPDNDPNYYHVVLYAVSEEDARKMAEAYVGFLRRQHDDLAQRENRYIDQYVKQIAFVEKRIPELDETLETSREKLDRLMETVLYRTEDEALAAIGELNRMINAARVDIAGIKAKIDAIHSNPSGKRTPEIVAKLEVMFVEEAIALHAAEARKREATELRAQAASYIDLNRTIREATGERKGRAAELGSVPPRLEARRASLAELKEQEPRVLDNAVFIYPVSD